MFRVSYLFSILILLIACCCNQNILAADSNPFASTIRDTDPLSPEQEQKSFRLPKGFQVKLFASEPLIQKPLNMAFDAKGRLWITDTIEYPFPVKVGTKGRDSIKILEDTNGDGHADKITTFKDGLNIPMGLYPYKDGVIAFSIPNIWFFRDTDGDGKADKTEKLFGPMGYEADTHGLNNAFRRGFDGWLYACHGFNNSTKVAGKDGHQIVMNSGNTYRMNLDGSRIEHFTWGQVNPFGMTMDPLGNQFTSDCHSKPVYQLLRNGYYPSFGKPDDGLGFVPPMMDHLHGSTAISGIAFYTGENFPEKFHGNVFSGNVMTGRINRNSLIYHGSTIIAHEEPDFLSTTDPWFRPVDIQNSADGSLYVADFYNKIIGHYEVPLNHPGRDRASGRIWKISYEKKQINSLLGTKSEDLSNASISELIKAWKHPSLTYRNHASDQLSDRWGLKALRQVEQTFNSSTHPTVRIHSLWYLHRMRKVTVSELRSASNDQHKEVRVHAMKVISESKNWNPQLHKLALNGLKDSYPFVQRAAVDALSLHPSEENIEPLIELIQSCPEKDNHLLYVARMALRNQLRDERIMTRLISKKYDSRQQFILADVCLGLKTSLSGVFLLDFLEADSNEEIDKEIYVAHAVQWIKPAQMERLVTFVTKKYKNDIIVQNKLMQSVLKGLKKKGSKPSKSLVQWGEALGQSLLDKLNSNSTGWNYSPLSDSGHQEDPWGIQNRNYETNDHKKSQEKIPFLTSLYASEHLTGKIASRKFDSPSKFSFYLSGHRGFPDKKAHNKNKVVLKDAETNEILKEAFPPRHDIARKIQWDLSAHKGKRIYLEIVDGDTGGGYAWLAIGGIQPDIISVPNESPREWTQKYIDTAELISSLKLKKLLPEVKKMLSSDQHSLIAKKELAKTLLMESSDGRKKTLVVMIGHPSIRTATQNMIIANLIKNDSKRDIQTLEELAKEIPSSLQGQMAENLSSDPSGVKTLLAFISKGTLSARILQQEKIKQRIIISGGKKAADKIKELTRDLPSMNQEIQNMIASKKKMYPQKERSISKGKEIFKKHCIVCHQVAGEGALVGPQLDGIGLRGVDRLLEDVLDPNRNVDASFRVTSVVMDDGKIYSGLIRKETDSRLTMVDTKGKEFHLNKEDIDDRLNSNLSLMPEKMGETIPEAEFYDLISYLVSQKKKIKK